MADNQFSVAVPNIFQALTAGEQGYKDTSAAVKQNRIDATREQAAQSLMRGGDSRSAIAQLLGIGDIQGAQTLSSMDNNNRDFQFRQQEATRAQGNADRSFGLQQQAANNPNIQKDENGNFIAFNKQGTGGRQLPIEGQTPANPFSYGKMNENQGKDSGYANRMFQSEGILRDPKSIDAATSTVQRTIDKLPILGTSSVTGLGNFAQSEDYQRYDQAARDFINATLRRESGAAISSSEFDNAYKQYLPRPGDSKEVLAQKQRNRQATIASIAGGAGNSYKPPFSFGPSGEMVPTGNAQQGTRPAPQAGAQPAAPQAPSAQNPPVRITSPEQRDALQPGTPYIAPDGSLRTKQ